MYDFLKHVVTAKFLPEIRGKGGCTSNLSGEGHKNDHS